MLKNDYDIHYTNEKIEVYFRLIYGIKSGEFYDVEQGLLQQDSVYPKIRTMLLDKKINEAEDLLFEYAAHGRHDVLKAGLMFYYRLNQMSDNELEESDFSRAEISDGIRELLSLYGKESLTSVFDSE